MEPALKRIRPQGRFTQQMIAEYIFEIILRRFNFKKVSLPLRIVFNAEFARIIELALKKLFAKAFHSANDRRIIFLNHFETS
mgnify:CR=1 FL=1